MIITIATAAITSIFIMLTVGYLLHEMGILQPRIIDYEEEYNELKGDLIDLKKELNEANKLLAMYERLEKIDTPFEDWVDINLETAELAQRIVKEWTQAQARRKNNVVNRVKTTEIAFGIHGFRVVRKETPEVKKIYVAYPPEDAEVPLQTIKLRA
jgi:hypothetical protein